MKAAEHDRRGPIVPVLMYHGISEGNERDEEMCSTNPAYSLAVQKFREQMEWLRGNSYYSLSIDTVVDGNEVIPQKSFVLTFDDGWANNYTHAFPALKEQSVHATIFVITGFIGTRPYLNREELREMSDAGISIQSHTVSHLPLTLLPVGKIRHELSASKMCLEDHLGRKVEFLSLPHGMGDRVVYDLAEEIGYRAVCISEPGYNHSFGAPALLKRMNVDGRYEIDDFRKIIERDRMMTASLVLSKAMKNLAKKVLGYKSYRAMYLLRYGSGSKVRRSGLP